MSGGGQNPAQGNPNLPQQSGMQGLPGVPQVQASTGPYQGAAVQQQVANQAANPNIAAFQQMMNTMGAAPQMTAYQGGSGPITPQMTPAHLNALAAQIQAQFNQQVGSQMPQPQAAAASPAAGAAPAQSAAPLNMATSSTTGYVAPVGSMPQSQYLANATKANAPVNLVSNPNILNQPQIAQMSSNPAVMAAEAQNSASPTITVSWNGNSYIIPNLGYMGNQSQGNGGGGQ